MLACVSREREESESMVGRTYEEGEKTEKRRSAREGKSVSLP